MDSQITSEIIDIANLPEKEKINIQYKTELLSNDKIEEFRNHFADRKEPYKGLNLRDYTVFMIFLNTKMKMFEIVNLKIHNVIDENYNVVDAFITSKYGSYKQTLVTINDELKDALRDFINSKKWSVNDFLFQNYRTGNPLSRKAIWEIIHKAEKTCGINLMRHIRYLRYDKYRNNTDYR